MPDIELRSVHDFAWGKVRHLLYQDVEGNVEVLNSDSGKFRLGFDIPDIDVYGELEALYPSEEHGDELFPDAEAALVEGIRRFKHAVDRFRSLPPVGVLTLQVNGTRVSIHGRTREERQRLVHEVAESRPAAFSRALLEAYAHSADASGDEDDSTAHLPRSPRQPSVPT